MLCGCCALSINLRTPCFTLYVVKCGLPTCKAELAPWRIHVYRACFCKIHQVVKIVIVNAPWNAGIGGWTSADIAEVAVQRNVAIAADGT